MLRMSYLLMAVVMVVGSLAIVPAVQKTSAQDDGTQMCVSSWADAQFVYQYVEDHFLVDAVHKTIDFLGAIRVSDTWVVNVSYWTESGSYIVQEFTIPISDDCDGFDSMMSDSHSWQCQTDLSTQEIEYLLDSGYYASLEIWTDGQQYWLGPFLVTVDYTQINEVAGYFEFWLEGELHTKTVSCTPVYHSDAASIEVATTAFVAGGQVFWTCNGNVVMDQGDIVYSLAQPREGYNLYAVVTGQEFDPAVCSAYDMDGAQVTGWYSNHGGLTPVGQDRH